MLAAVLLPISYLRFALGFGSSTTGTLKTTVTASADGYFRYVFTGSATTSAVNSAADYIDEQ